MTTDPTTTTRPADEDALRLAMQEALRLLDAGEPVASAATVLRRAMEANIHSLVIQWTDDCRGSRWTSTYTSEEEIAAALESLAIAAGIEDGKIVDPSTLDEDGDAWHAEVMGDLWAVKCGATDYRARRGGPWSFSDGGAEAALASWQ